MTQNKEKFIEYFNDDDMKDLGLFYEHCRFVF